MFTTFHEFSRFVFCELSMHEYSRAFMKFENFTDKISSKIGTVEPHQNTYSQMLVKCKQFCSKKFTLFFCTYLFTMRVKHAGKVNEKNVQKILPF